MCSCLKNNFTPSKEEYRIICSSRKIKSSIFKLLNWLSVLLSEHWTGRDTVELHRTVTQFPFYLFFFPLLIKITFLVYAWFLLPYMIYFSFMVSYFDKYINNVDLCVTYVYYKYLGHCQFLIAIALSINI